MIGVRRRVQVRLQLTAHGIPLTPDLREYVQRRAHFALGRFTRRIDRISIRLADVNDAGVDLDKCCTVRIDAGLAQAVVIRERHDDIRMAVALAAERAARTVERRFRLLSATDRHRSWPRSPNLRD